jgi:UDP-N-acetylglucosamine--N-acetylmuramyl-(pentapeptide) pyrophosphoryl-undecaprenol N-acetylglucosamine transferase
MRLALGGGGSGGHVFPALAVAQALRACATEPVELLYLGRADGVEATLARDAGIPFRDVTARPLRDRHLFATHWSAGAMAGGVADAARALRAFKADAVLLTGGFASVPVGIAAWLLRKPVILYQPDIVPGWAVRTLYRFATRVCVTHASSVAEASGDSAPGAKAPSAKTTVTGYPLRSVFNDLDRPMARARFHLNGTPTVLVAGAVQGARRINDAVAADLRHWVDFAQIIHVTGPADYRRMQGLRAALPENLQHRYQPFEYMGDDFPTALAASDIAVSRAGASVLGEYPATSLASVLVPLPMAGGHQFANARMLEAAGAAVVMNEADAPDSLLGTVREILQDADRLADMRRHATDAGSPDGARRIAKVIWEARK